MSKNNQSNSKLVKINQSFLPPKAPEQKSFVPPKPIVNENQSSSTKKPSLSTKS